jgi:hypothetical protein
LQRIEIAKFPERHFWHESYGKASQGSLFVETARLSETFYEHLRKHPVPLEEAALKAISNNSQALDVYCWLAYRLHVLPAARTVSWPALFAQFGSSYKKLAHFKMRFVDSLKIATAVYRDANVELDEKGLILRPSPPPVAPKLIAVTGRTLIARVQFDHENPCSDISYSHKSPAMFVPGPGRPLKARVG